MNGVHDIGGMHGFGPVVIEKDEPVFHEAWEGRVWGMVGPVRALPGEPVRRLRALIESMAPQRYLTVSYYERWLHGVETSAIGKGLITRDELDRRTEALRQRPDTPVPRREDTEAVHRILALLKRQNHPDPEGPPPRFHAGDAVMVRNLNPTGHTRLPRYIRGKRGTVVRVNGWYAIHDEETDGLGPNPQTVYTVRFDGREVWGPGAETNLLVCVEMWEGYLDPSAGE